MMENDRQTALILAVRLGTVTGNLQRIPRFESRLLLRLSCDARCDCDAYRTAYSVLAQLSPV
jgi:hypothetical protein